MLSIRNYVSTDEHKARSPKLITIEGCRNSRKGLGLRITGGRNRDRDEHFGIFVKEVIPGSLAATGGKFINIRGNQKHKSPYRSVICRRPTP